MTSGREAGGERLACGRAVDDLLEQVSLGRDGYRDEHQQRCVHCQAALADYRRLWAPMAELAAEPVNPPGQRIESVLRQLRARLDRPDYAVLTGPDGTLRIAARVVVATARQTAQQVPGVRVALTHHIGGGDGPQAAVNAVTAGVAGAHTAVEVVLAADYGTDLNALADRVRAVVTDAIARSTGLTAAEVTVVVDDVLPPRRASGPGGVPRDE